MTKREMWEREGGRRWRMWEGDETTSGYAGFTQGSITDSRWVEVSRSNPRHQRSNISIFWYRINGSFLRARRRHKFSAGLSCITDRQKDRPWLHGSMAIVRDVSRVVFHSLLTDLSFVLFHVDNRTRIIIEVIRSTALSLRELRSRDFFKTSIFARSRELYYINSSHYHTCIINEYVIFVVTFKLINMKSDEL